MFDLDKETIEFDCPSCGFYNEIFYRQARLNDMIICRGCKTNIQLNDQMYECRKAYFRLKKIFNKLNYTLRNLDLMVIIIL